MSPPEPLAIVVLISGRGTNLQAIIEACRSGEIPGVVRAVISNRPGVAGLDRAAAAGIETRVVDHKRFPDRGAFEQALRAVIDAYSPGLVALAGFMRVLTPAFVSHYEGRLINIHPSLLPRFPGLDTHQRAIEAGASAHGASVHFVSPELDAGPVIVQASVPVLDDDDAESLAARVLEQEHRIFPLAIRWFAEGRLTVHDGVVYLDGRPVERQT